MFMESIVKPRFFIPFLAVPKNQAVSHFARTVLRRYSVRHLMLSVLIFFAAAAVAQQSQTGAPAFGSMMSFGPVSINLSNLDVHLAVPIFSKPGRGAPLNYSMSYDSLIWRNFGDGAGFPAVDMGWARTGPFGWIQYTPPAQAICPQGEFNYTIQTWSNYHDPLGTVHPVGVAIGSPICPGAGNTPPGIYPINDGSGLSTVVSTTGVSILTADGTVIQPFLMSFTGANDAPVFYGSSASITDANGNQITSQFTSPAIVDTIGTSYSIGNNFWNPQSFGYTDSNGVQQAVNINYGGYSVRTNFGCNDYTGGPLVAGIPQSITYPDGSSLQFTYEPTPGFPTSITGRIASVTLRTGGTISFAYSGSNNGVNCTDMSTATLTMTTTDGNWTFQHAVASATSASTTVTDGKNNQTVINFQSGVETQRQIYTGSASSGALLATTITCYNGNKTSCPTATITTPITEISAITQLPNGIQSEEDNFFSASGLATEVDDYGFQSGAPGPLVRKSITTYASLGNNITGRPHTLTVCSPSGTDADCNGSGTKVAQSTYGYDGAATPPSGATQHVAVSGARGNLTSTLRWLNTTGGTLSTTSTFDDAGRTLTSTDAKENVTSFGYGCNDAYVTKITGPSTGATHITMASYDCNTGRVINSTDQNGKVTSFFYDSMMRPTQTNFPDGGQTAISYPSTTQVNVQNKINASESTLSSTLVDGYGRTSRTAVANGESTPYDQQDFCYDGDGLLGFKSYPYQGNSPVFSTAAQCSGPNDISGNGDIFGHDGMGRIAQITHTDGNVRTDSTIIYTGRAAEITDEGNGTFQVSRILQNDALGRLTNVCEVYGGAALLGGGTPSSCGLDISGIGFLTSYGYDILGNLTTVSQGGVTPRTYTYDSLSRQTSATDPESGTTSYAYDANGNLSSRIDARNITTNYAYDALNRITGRSYLNDPAGTPAATYNYDETSVWGTSLANTIGRLTSQKVVSPATGNPVLAEQVFSYDPIGRPALNAQCTPNTCPAAPPAPFSLAYQYDLLGDVTSAGNGVGVTFNYSYNTAGRLAGISSSLNDAAHPGTLLSNMHYSPDVITGVLGNGVLETTNFTNRGLLQSYQATIPNGQPGTGSVAISGTLQSTQQQTQAASSGSTSFSIGGTTDRSVTVTISCITKPHLFCTTETFFDTGNLSVTVNGFTTANVPYGPGSSPAALASSLAGALNVAGSPVTAVASGSTVTMTANTQGVSTNYSWSSMSATTLSSRFSGSSFPISPVSGSLAGGQNAVFITVYDSGSTAIAVNNHSDSYSWSGSATTPAAIAQGLCNAINADSAASATASTNGIQGQCPLGSMAVGLVAKQSGSSTDYALSASSSSTLNSFSAGCPGACTAASLSGGGNPAYAFTLAQAPNGQITSVNDFVNGNWSFAYDQLGHLASSNKNAGQQTFNYGYDVAGNRWQQNAPQGGPAPQYMFNSKNQFIGSGVTYDASGEEAADGLGNSFTWDAEGRLVQVNQGSTVTASYVYDAAGRRVHGPNGEYVYDLDGRAITQMNLTGGWAYGEIYAGARHLATYSFATTNFFHPDWLGTKRATTGVNGTVSETCTGFAFGDGTVCAGTNWTFNGFTDDIHDPETNLEHTLFRQYSSTQGRWLTPDPSGLASADLTSPQSLNQYAYVSGDPVNAVDPDGLELMGPCFMCGGAGGFSAEFAGGPSLYDDGSPCNDPLYAGVHPSGCPNLGGGGLSINIGGFGGLSHQNLVTDFLRQVLPIDTCPAGGFECPTDGSPLFGNPDCGQWCAMDALQPDYAGISSDCSNTASDLRKTLFQNFVLGRDPKGKVLGVALGSAGAAVGGAAGGAASGAARLASGARAGGLAFALALAALSATDAAAIKNAQKRFDAIAQESFVNCVANRVVNSLLVLK
jgi:RHS repeat-associated protein